MTWKTHPAFNREVLLQASSWCALRADPNDPKASLRDPAIAPRVLEDSYSSAIRSVVTARSWSLFGLPRPPDSTVHPGRLLAYFPDAELACGAAEIESNGFFDVNNAPPWGTWVALLKDRSRNVDSSFEIAVICWIPELFVFQANAGIVANPEECIQWLDCCRDGLRETWSSWLAWSYPPA